MSKIRVQLGRPLIVAFCVALAGFLLAPILHPSTPLHCGVAAQHASELDGVHSSPHSTVPVKSCCCVRECSCSGCICKKAPEAPIPTLPPTSQSVELVFVGVIDRAPNLNVPPAVLKKTKFVFSFPFSGIPTALQKCVFLSRFHC